MSYFEFFNTEQMLAELGLSPATLAFRLLDDNFKDALNAWVNFERDQAGGSRRMVALRNYNNSLATQLKDGKLTEAEAEVARGVTKKLAPYLREQHIKYMQIEVLQWPLPLKTTLELHAAEKVEPFDGLQDVRQRVAGENRLLFVARDPFVKNGILIDVQIALVDKISSDIRDVKYGVDGKGVARPKIAIFYAISNADKVSGIAEYFLRSVAGSIKAVVPHIEFYSTLSPMPGFVPWITGGKGLDTGLLEHAYMLTGSNKPLMSVQQFGDTVLSLQQRELHEIDQAFYPVLSRVGALYLLSGTTSQGRFKYTNSVAGFHLPNGARLGRIIVGGDKSPKGQRQSGTLMANYFYDLEHLDIIAEQNRAGKPQVSEGVAAMLMPSTRSIGGPRQDHQFGHAAIYRI